MSYLHKVDAKSHPSAICPLCNTHTHDTHHLFNCIHICTTLSSLDLWTDPAGATALLARRAEKNWLVDHKREHRTHPPLAKVMGVGRQHKTIIKKMFLVKKIHDVNHKLDRAGQVILIR